MENKFQTSFIPKRSLEERGGMKVKTPHNLLWVISSIILIITIIAVIGVFAWSYIIKKETASVVDQIAEKDRTMPYSQMDEIVRIDDKMQAASNLLNNHTAVSGIFGFLEEATLKNLRYNSFAFSYISPTKVTLSMKGQAKTFGAVAKQAELLASTSTKKYFKDPLFSNINLDTDGNVSFSFLTTVDPSLILYKNTLNSSTQ